MINRTIIYSIERGINMKYNHIYIEEARRILDAPGPGHRPERKETDCFSGLKM